VLGNAALRDPANLLWPPVAGFVTIVLGFAVGYFGVARSAASWRGAADVRLCRGNLQLRVHSDPAHGVALRPAGVGRAAGAEHGSELAVWSVGLLVLTGLSGREGWRGVESTDLHARWSRDNQTCAGWRCRQ